MKKILNFTISSLVALSLTAIYSQGTLPPKAKHGECYALCSTKNVYRDKKVRVLVKPAYKKLEIVPARYKTVIKRIVVKPATKKYKYVAPKYKRVMKTVTVKDGRKKLVKVPEEFKDKKNKIITKEKEGRWITSENKVPECDSADPEDCKIVFYSEKPAVYTSYESLTKVKDETVDVERVSPVVEKVEVLIQTSPARLREVKVAPVYKTIESRQLVEEEKVREITVPAKYAYITKKALSSKAGVKEWRKVPCNTKRFTVVKRIPDTHYEEVKKTKVVTKQVVPTKVKMVGGVKVYEALPVFYKLGSHKLTKKSKKTLDKKLYKMMKGRPDIHIQIMSHTDSRGSSKGNLSLSKRRAKSVVKYLVKKGIDPSRLSYKGYGEKKLLNNCKNGVRCSEKKHAKNRRTEFRIKN